MSDRENTMKKNTINSLVMTLVMQNENTKRKNHVSRCNEGEKKSTE